MTAGQSDKQNKKSYNCFVIVNYSNSLGQKTKLRKVKEIVVASGESILMMDKKTYNNKNTCIFSAQVF